MLTLQPTITRSSSRLDLREGSLVVGALAEVEESYYWVEVVQMRPMVRKQV
jgi:hypothetical protein